MRFRPSITALVTTAVLAAAPVVGAAADAGSGGTESSRPALRTVRIDDAVVVNAVLAAEPQPEPEPEPAPAPEPTPPPDPRLSYFYGRPCEGPVISEYGRRGGGRHEGLDAKCPNRGPVGAALAGRVVQAGAGMSGYGNSVTIDHGDGMRTLYAHLSAVTVRNGDWVEQGQLIGRIGQTGRASTPHLHYEVRDGGRPLNPRPYWD